MGFDICVRFQIFFIKLLSLFSIGKDLLDIGLLQQERKVVGDRITNAAVGRAFDFARGQHIPEGNTMTKKKSPFFFYGLGKSFSCELRENFPKTVLRMTVIEGHLPGFYRREGPQNQDFGMFIIDWCKWMLD